MTSWSYLEIMLKLALLCKRKTEGKKQFVERGNFCTENCRGDGKDREFRPALASL